MASLSDTNSHSPLIVSVFPATSSFVEVKPPFFESHSSLGDYGKSLYNLNKKKVVSVTPLKLTLKSFILELKDSALGDFCKLKHCYFVDYLYIAQN